MLSKLIFENIAACSGEITLAHGLIVLEKDSENAKPEVLSALSVLSGDKSSLVANQQGATAKISGSFTNLDEEIWLAAEKLGCAKSASLVISREIDAEGNLVSRLNGQVVQNPQADALCHLLIAVCNANDSLDQKKEKYVDIVDRIAKNQDKVAAYKAAFRELAKSTKTIALLSADEEERKRQIAVLQKETSEIESANLKSGELEKLAADIYLLTHQQAILDALGKISEYVSAPNGAAALVEKAANEAEALSKMLDGRHQQIQNISAALKNQLKALKLTENYAKEQIQNIGKATASLGLKETQERQLLVSALAEKYGGSVEAAMEYAEQAWIQLTDVEFGAEHLEKLQKNEGTLLLNIQNTAAALSKSRIEAFGIINALFAKISAAVGVQGIDLHLSHELTNPGAKGRDKFEILVSQGGGAPTAPENFAALSASQYALLAAVKAVVSTATTKTAVYIDIDTGLSEESAEKFSALLKASSADKQIICVSSGRPLKNQADLIM